MYYAETQKWGGRPNNDLSLLEDALKFKFATYLICLLLVVAAVDTIPDPPAISPPGGHSFTISAFHLRGVFTQLEKEWFAPSRSLQSEQNINNWLSFRLALDTKPAANYQIPSVHHATDSSPPAFY